MGTCKVCIIGNAGSGKSTLAGRVFTELKMKGFNAELVPEQIRSDIQVNGPMQSIWEQYRTIINQREVEDSIPKSVEYLITDSGTLTPYFYACLYAHKENERERLVLQDMYKFFLRDMYMRRYTHVFFLPMKETYEKNPNMLNDGTRYQSKEEIETLETHMNLMFCKLHNMDNVYALTGPLESRVDALIDIITK